MKIDSALLLPVASVVASGLLLVAGKTRVFEALAALGSLLWLLIALHLFNWPISSVSPTLVIGATLLISGLMVYLNTDNKREVTASTVVGILGGVQLVAAMS
jgi:hypothetical protein